MLAESGVEVGILSSRRSAIVSHRAAELGISLVIQGESDKKSAFQRLIANKNLPSAHTGFMGDDVLDLPVMSLCGFSATVPGAPQELKTRALITARCEGGHGAVREVCEFIMRAQGTYDTVMAKYL